MKFKSRSTQNQDLFTLCVLNGLRNGTYVEIGAKHPEYGNNTYLLEKEFGWRGVSVEIDESYAVMFSQQRDNPCICADALSIDYDKVFQEHGFGPHIDFLQIDIEPAQQSLAALKMIDFDKYSFSVITFEHDHYTRPGKQHKTRDRSRAHLLKQGYTLVAADVCHDGLCFEDWWINEKYLTTHDWEMFTCSGKNWNQHGMSAAHRELLAAFVNEL